MMEDDLIVGDWPNRFAVRLMVRLWWRAEHDFSSLDEYAMKQAKQLYYRLSYLNDDELELLRLKYFRRENHPLGDAVVAEHYQMPCKEFRVWRLAVVEKLEPYRSNPNRI
ncbi:hypothetical protein [Levilactobacillus brevis]|uniref:hypothetical protein n=1 Tax=Levilactobacillus brevis TaxID=1580 RepID=UPI0030D07B50